MKMIFKMYLIVCILYFSSLIQIKGEVFDKNSCYNNTDKFWNNLDVWNNVRLFEKWKIVDNKNISTSCRDELTEMIEEAFYGTLWAVKMFDASGHYEPSIFQGNAFLLGSNTLCQNLQSLRFKINSTKYDGKYIRKTYENRFINNDFDVLSVPPYPVKFAVVKVTLNLNKFCQFYNHTEFTLFYGVCLPFSCSAPDVRTTMELIADENIIDIENVRIVPGNYSAWNDYRFFILSLIFFGISLLISLGTILEYINIRKEEVFKSCTWYRIFNAFSVRNNLKIIFSYDVGDDTIAPIHGLKFISMVWIIFLHSCLMLIQIAKNKKIRDNSETDIVFQTISNGQYSVDTFFTLSGVLVSFLFFRTLKKYSVKTLIGYDNFFAQILFYLIMLIYRLIRLSFPYIVIIILTGFLTDQKANLSAIELPNKDHKNCAEFWWRNVLYINTFYPIDEMCMGWSWYLSLDTQFFALGVPLLIIALRSKLISFLIGCVFLITSWITTAVITHKTGHVIDITDPFAEYDELYDKPWTRLGPYFIGMFSGWYLFNINCTLKMRRKISILLWAITFTTMIFIIYAPLFFASSNIFGLFYTTLSHSLWSLAISWIMISCVTGNGFLINNILSWKYFYPLSRLSYCAYLIHPIIIRIILLSSDTSIYISFEIVATLFFGFTCLTFLMSMIFSLCFESPIVALLRFGHPMRRKK